MPSDLPEETSDFLESNRALLYSPSAVECGAIALHSVNDLTTRDFWVNSDGRDWADDPYGSNTGYYSVPAVDLVSQAEGFDPDGILAWIPRAKSFGTWDCDHWDLIVFAGTSWGEIVADPARFLNAQWDPNCLFGYLKPWIHDFDWSDGRPW